MEKAARSAKADKAKALNKEKGNQHQASQAQPKISKSAEPEVQRNHHRDRPMRRVTPIEVVINDVSTEKSVPGINGVSSARNDRHQNKPRVSHSSTDDHNVITPEEHSVKETSRGAVVRQFAGTILAHGKAPYQHQKKNKPSYFVRLGGETQGAENTREIWGIDLERAMKEAGLQVGDKAHFKNHGFQWVDVTVDKFGEDGKTVVGKETITVKRNAWSAASLDQQSTATPEPSDKKRSPGKAR